MAWACRCGSSIRSEAARSGGPVIFKKILVLLERRYSKAIALQAATTPTSPAPSGSMGAEVSLAQCGCGTNERGDGRLDVSWQAPQTLVRTPNGKLSGATPGTPESPKKKAELTQVAARELAVRLLPNSKNGRSHDIEKMFHKYDLAPEQMKALLDACDQSAGNSALILAAKNGFADTCRVLLDAGANVHATNRKRQSALDLAAAAGYRKVVDPCVC